MSDTPTPTGEDTRRHAEVVAEHLPAGFTAEFDGGPPVASNGSSNNGTPVMQASDSNTDVPSTLSELESSLRLQGGDMHRDLFKRARSPGIRRAQTFSSPVRGEDISRDGLTAAEQQEPQGFRRQYVLQKNRGFNGGANLPITRSFYDHLALYGSFAGEDLADSDDEAIIDDEEEEYDADDEERESRRPSESSPLLTRQRSTRVLRKGDASTSKTFFTLLKSFVGTGIMFLPKAFRNGGILFSSLTVLFIAVISMIAFNLLLACRAKYGGGYGDIGNSIAGPRVKALILGSITLSQLGFVCTGLVFVAENWYSFLHAVTNGGNPLSTPMLIVIQAVLLVPLAWIRNIGKLGITSLIADVFILIGVTYIWYFDISTLATQGVHRSVQLFNPAAYTLTIGSAIFTFEGIGLILPIQASMKRPEQFPWLLGVVMLIITCLYTSIGALSYAALGENTQIELINNFPQDNPLVNAVQFMYALAVLMGDPVQLFPAMRILEGKLFGRRSGKKDAVTKWKKNAFRSSLVALCIGVSIVGSANLDRFVALIGSFACVPLVYIYPPYLHYKGGLATTRWLRIGDIALMVLGTFGMVYTTVITVLNSFVSTPV